MIDNLTRSTRRVEGGDFPRVTLEHKNNMYHIHQAKFDAEQSESWGENSCSAIERRELEFFQIKVIETISKDPAERVLSSRCPSLLMSPQKDLLEQFASF